MNISYDDIKKDLPCEQLCRLFMSVGWCNGVLTPEQKENFNIGFINSTLVVSAWEDDHLVGAVRVLSDKAFRSIIYDLLVDPEYHNQGIGKELVRRCIEHFPNSEWLVQTTEQIYNYYEKMGFRVNKDVFLTIPSKYF
ncbi:GNAT family N-acetyltransferase [Paenibacillus marinisediminis]